MESEESRALFCLFYCLFFYHFFLNNLRCFLWITCRNEVPFTPKTEIFLFLRKMEDIFLWLGGPRQEILCSFRGRPGNFFVFFFTLFIPLVFYFFTFFFLLIFFLWISFRNEVPFTPKRTNFHFFWKWKTYVSDWANLRISAGNLVQF